MWIPITAVIGRALAPPSTVHHSVTGAHTVWRQTTNSTNTNTIHPSINIILSNHIRLHVFGLWEETGTDRNTT